MKTTEIREDGSLIVSTEDVGSAMKAMSDLALRFERGDFDHLTVEAYEDREGHEFRVIALRDDQRRSQR